MVGYIEQKEAFVSGLSGTSKFEVAFAIVAVITCQNGMLVTKANNPIRTQVLSLMMTLPAVIALLHAVSFLSGTERGTAQRGWRFVEEICCIVIPSVSQCFSCISTHQ